MKHLNYADKMPSNYTLYLWGDIHLGNVGTSYDAIKSFKRRVRSHKHSYVAFGGDQIEAISVTDRRFNIDIHPTRLARVSAQRDAFIEIFDSIADRVLWVLMGNHEDKFSNYFDITNDIAKGLDADNGTYLAKVDLGAFRLLDWHGYGSVRSVAGEEIRRQLNKLLSIKRRLSSMALGSDCDVMVVHHYHFLDVLPPNQSIKLYSEDNRLHEYYPTGVLRIPIDTKEGTYIVPEEYRYYAVCGSALRGYVEGATTYVEKFGLAPNELGCVRIKVKNDQLETVEKVILGGVSG